MTDLRVAVSLASLAPGRMGGSERYAVELLRALGAGAAPELEVRALVPSGAWDLYGASLGADVRSERVGDAVPPTGPARAAGLLAGLALGGRRGRTLEGADVVHHPFTVPVLRPPGATVLSLHDVAHHDLPQAFGAAERRFRRLGYDRPARRAAGVVCGTAHARAAAIDALGLDPARVQVATYGIDHSAFTPRPGPAEEARAAALALPARYVLYPANMWPHKNHERLARALARTADDALALVLTGAVDERRLQAIRSAAGGAAGRVMHLGRVTDADLPVIYRRARAVVFPSLSEGFGAPVLEAMACGVPVASSGEAALAEVTGDAALGFNARDERAIAAAINAVTGEDAELRDRLVRAGHRRAASFTWAASARAHADVWRRAAAT